MTLLQLKYVVEVAKTGNITEAAKRLYLSQPSLTNAIRELEKEMQITIFCRTNRGVTVTNEGDLFLSYARQVLEQTDLLTEKFTGKGAGRQTFFRFLSALFFCGQCVCQCHSGIRGQTV